MIKRVILFSALVCIGVFVLIAPVMAGQVSNQGARPSSIIWGGGRSVSGDPTADDKPGSGPHSLIWGGGRQDAGDPTGDDGPRPGRLIRGNYTWARSLWSAWLSR